MQSHQLELISEQQSPLFRIMSVYNVNETTRKHFDNNIVAFHIGNGYVLSVAHNLRTQSGMIRSMDEAFYQAEVFPKLSQSQQQMFDHSFPLDPTTNKRYLMPPTPGDENIIREIFRQINFDTRWVTLMQKRIVVPHLIVQFGEPQFYKSNHLTSLFESHANFYEPVIKRHTFLLEVELVKPFYESDIALYRIVNTPSEIIAALPYLEVDFSVFDDGARNYYCLQSSTANEIGRMINKAQIEGYIEHFNMFTDTIGGNYIMDGFRYLIKGYFRFGSSGAPYIFYDEASGRFKANAIQSEACPIQLSIDSKREGNFQYVNAIASPLSIVEEELRRLTTLV